MVSTKVYGLIAVLVLTTAGCATNRSPPIQVRMAPNDCANREMIINHLDQHAKQPRGTFETEKQYEYSRAEIRRRIWDVRYNCQPV